MKVWFAGFLLAALLCAVVGWGIATDPIVQFVTKVLSVGFALLFIIAILGIKKKR